jgi:hypothetical protein
MSRSVAGAQFGTRDPFRPPASLGTALVVLLAACGTFAFFAAIATVAELGDFSNRAAIVIDDPRRGDAVAGLVWLCLVLWLVTGGVWLAWQERTHRNLWALGVADLRFRPAWAVFWWLLPFANLVMPYKVVREVDVRSAALRGRRPRRGIVRACWWATLLLGSFAVPVGALARVGVTDAGYRSRSTVADLTDVLQAADWFIVIGAASVAIAAALAIAIVRSVNTSQRGSLVAVPPPPEQMPPPPLQVPSRPDAPIGWPD